MHQQAPRDFLIWQQKQTRLLAQIFIAISLRWILIEADEINAIYQIPVIGRNAFSDCLSR